MYIKRLICVLLSFVLGISVLPNAHAVDQDGAQAPPYSRQADIELAQQVESPDALTYEFTYLKQSISLWADGKGDLLLEQHVKNTSSSSSDVFDRITWYIGWPPSSISNISAKDSSGPLTVQEVVSGGGLQLTVIFRRPVPQNATYAFKLLVTIAGMVQGTGNNWLAAWSTSGGSNIKTFEHVLALPANANVTSISPPPTERRGNVITWRLVNQSSWSLTINVPYVLSDQITVPLLLQTSDPWRSDIYAYNTSPVDNIERWGCLMTSGAMIVNYLSQAQENPFRTNPRILNNWLKDNSGYTENNGVKHAWVGKYGRTSPQNIAIYWNRSIQYNTTVVDYYLRSGYPVVLGVKPTVVDGKTIPGHYVVATGRATENGVQTYRINDPYYGSTTLKSKWSNVALTMILYSASEANQQLLNFVAQSPIEFVVVDPIGRKSGFDPTTNTTWTQIPDAYYMYDGLGTVSGDSDPILMKTMNVPDPLDGEYTVIVYGTGSGSYTMEVSSMDWQGISGHQKFIGTTNPGQTHIYTVSYTQVVKQVFLPLVTR